MTAGYTPLTIEEIAGDVGISVEEARAQIELLKRAGYIETSSSGDKTLIRVNTPISVDYGNVR